MFSHNIIVFCHTCSNWNWMVFQQIDASRHFQVDVSSIILLHMLSQIRMITCQSLFTFPSIGQEISMLWAHSQFIYLFLAGRSKTAMVKKHFSFANFRWSNILLGHNFTGMVVIWSFPVAGPQCESSKKKEQLI